MTSQEIKDEFKDIKKHISTLYDRIFTLSEKLAYNSIEDAKIGTEVKLSRPKSKVRSSIKWGSIISFLAALATLLINDL